MLESFLRYKKWVLPLTACQIEFTGASGGQPEVSQSSQGEWTDPQTFVVDDNGYARLMYPMEGERRKLQNGVQDYGTRTDILTASGDQVLISVNQGERKQLFYRKKPTGIFVSNRGITGRRG